MERSVTVQITYRNTDLDAAEESNIRAYANRLERFSPYLEATRVTVETPHRSRRNGCRQLVMIEMRVPGSEIRVCGGPAIDEPQTDLCASLRQVFRAARRELEAHTRSRCGERTEHGQAVAK